MTVLGEALGRYREHHQQKHSGARDYGYLNVYRTVINCGPV